MTKENKQCFDILVKNSVTNSYELNKKIDFLLTVVCSTGLTSENRYNDWCDEYDRLNKHLLDEKLSINLV